MRRTKVVCTLGPASASREGLERLIEAGMDVARLNLSHRRPGEVSRWLEVLRRAEARAGRPVAVLLDMRGPQVRTGEVPGGGLRLEAGQPVLVGPEPPGAGGLAWLPVAVEGMDRLAPGSELQVAEDGPVLAVEAPRGRGALCRAVRGGEAGSRRRVTVRGAGLSLPPLAPEDLEDLREALGAGIDFVAASFVREAGDVLEVRRLLRREGSEAAVVAKLECREAVGEVEAILEAADALMVARGDLGVELPPEEVPLIQKRVIALANRAGKPVITATQMLESMVSRPPPPPAAAAGGAEAGVGGP
ncbi:MAG: pyruvate kinase, partial [Acetobacteraceae bacterium]|nr:pyruvate kinase [Acetobacteraceae bacterium]